MKNIPLSSLPTFYGKNNEYPDTFLFEFDILCRRYNYVQDAQKLKLLGSHERHGEDEETGNQTETTFGFPILDTTPNVNMKNIPLWELPTFYGKNSEDLDTFLFEFDILCRSYNYVQDAQKLKLLRRSPSETLS